MSAWIELHSTIWTHRKTLRLARMLDIDADTAVVRVMRLSHWALDNTPDGVLSPLEPEIIAYAAGWTGDAVAFLDALIECGWVDRDGGTLSLHEWWEYGGKVILSRRKDAERKRIARRPDNPPPSQNGHRDVPRMSDGRPADVQCNSNTNTRVTEDVPYHSVSERNTSSGDLAGGGASIAREEVAREENPSPPDDIAAVAVQVSHILGISGSTEDVETIAALCRDYAGQPFESLARRCRRHYPGWDRLSLEHRVLKYGRWLEKERAPRPELAVIRGSKSTAEPQGRPEYPWGEPKLFGVPEWDEISLMIFHDDYARRHRDYQWVDSLYNEGIVPILDVEVTAETLTLVTVNGSHAAWLREYLDHRIRECMRSAGLGHLELRYLPASASMAESEAAS